MCESGLHQLSMLVNAAMLRVELAAGYRSGSVSVMADAIVFGGDALNHGVSLAVLSAAPACWHLAFFVLGSALWNLWSGQVPDAITMGAIGVLALDANLRVA